MLRAKGRKNLTNRRAFVALGLAALGTGLPARGSAQAKAPADGRATSAAASAARTPARTQSKAPVQRARLPRRLAADFHSHIETRLPHLRAPFERAARATGFNWRLLAALGYQESRWRPAAVSPRGAQGVMMLMPVTAKKMGVRNVFSPDENISAGARYLAYLRQRIPKRIRDPDRTWLATAAYNMGISHLEDGRIITQMRKKNPDRWADVRVSLPKLSDPHWHSRVKHGYANGRETVEFVERIAQFAAILESTVPDRVMARD